MEYGLEIKEEAYYDIKEAYSYYEEKRVGLGERFLDILGNYLDRIQKYPEHYQNTIKPYKEAYIKDFPYTIIYEKEENRVIVYAVFCTWKDPKSKPKK